MSHRNERLTMYDNCEEEKEETEETESLAVDIMARGCNREISTRTSANSRGC